MKGSYMRRPEVQGHKGQSHFIISLHWGRQTAKLRKNKKLQRKSDVVFGVPFFLGAFLYDIHKFLNLYINTGHHTRNFRSLHLLV